MTCLRKVLLFLLTAILTLSPALAHGPTPQKVDETIVIDAPPSAVWDVVKDFGNIASWHPLLASSTGHGGNAQGGDRDIVLKTGGTLNEGLDEYIDKDMTYSYRLSNEDVNHFPVSFYSATLTVTPEGDKQSKVEWIGRFYRGDTGNFPPDNLNDEAATKAMTDFFQQGLAGLKAKVEKK